MKKMLQNGVEPKPPINFWTIAHFATGFVVGFLGISLKYAIIIVIMWEIVEQGVLVPLGITWPPESLLDSFVDIILGMVGYLIGRFVYSKVKDEQWYKRWFDIR
ncbi:MAG: hypothetical protein E3J86_03730 [Candidatus Thorarchaeota archaeon]|nr:MAG: hypothetical protein E3J86_03730 [Candidatus Thorarchaeota archaeon]